MKQKKEKKRPVGNTKYIFTASTGFMTALLFITRCAKKTSKNKQLFCVH